MDSLFNTLGQVAYDGLRYLVENKIIVRKGLTFYHRDCELEFFFLASLSKDRSKMGKMLEKIQTAIREPLVFENVISIESYGIEYNDDLVEQGVIVFSNGVAKIDFSKFAYTVQSRTIVIKIRIRAPENLKQLLVSHRLERHPRHTEERIETRVEVVLDYAELWKTTFDQYAVRDIDFVFILAMPPETILGHISRRQAKRIIEAAKSAATGNADAIKFLNVMTKNFLLFQSDMAITRLLGSISTNSDALFVKDVYPTMQSAMISDTGYTTILPGDIKVRVECKIDGNKAAVHGSLIIDRKKYFDILSEIFQTIQKETLKLKF